MKQPKVSIIIPVHNVALYLEQCINSVLGQTLKEIEVIAINDGSDDNSLEILESYSASDERLIIINNAKASGNGGTPRNQGMKIARGEYIGFVDSDDWIEPDMYELMYLKAKEDAFDIVIMDGFVNEFTDNFEIRKYQHKYTADESSVLYKYHPSCFSWDKIYRKSFLDEKDLWFPGVISEDVSFVQSACISSNNIGFCDGILYHYRRNREGSITVNHRVNSSCDFEFEAYRLIEKWMENNNIPERYKLIVNMRKIKSYLYTLNLINFKHFKGFYTKVQQEYRDIRNPESIKELFILLDEYNNYREFVKIKYTPWIIYYLEKRTVIKKIINIIKTPGKWFKNHFMLKRNKIYNN